MNWPKPQLQEFCRIIQGGRSGLSGNDFVQEGIPAYGAGGLNGYLPTHEFDEPAVILSSIGARCGKCFYAEGKWASLANTQLIFPDATKADVRFLWIQLNDESRWHRSGTGQPFIKPSDVKAHRVLLPPLAEQRRIVEGLDRAEALRAKRRAALAQLDSLTQSLFLDLFGDPKSNPKKWPCVPFAELGENQDSQRVPVKSSDRDGRQGKYPYYGASGIIDWVDDFIYEGERLLIGEDGANLVARSTPVAYIARGQYWVNNHAHVIADNGRADLRFLEFFIEQLDLKPFISGTAQPKLNRSNLDRIAVPFPPIPLQREFARRVTAVEALKTVQRAALAELDALFATLQHRAFRGEL